MRSYRMQVVLLAGKATKDDRLSFLIFVLVGNGRSVRGDRKRMWRLIPHLELFLKRHSLELSICPLHFEFFRRNELFLADSQQFVPSEAGNCGFSMSPFVHPTGP